MNWYGGSMAEAVSLSKQQNSIFVVFVEGDNDQSKELAETIDHSSVQERLAKRKNFLAVKLKSGSENYTFFAQIYQFVPVPSLFFIGRNGTPLEVVCAGIDPEELATRIDRIAQEHLKIKTAGAEGQTPKPSTSAQNLRDETNNFIQSEANAESTSVSEEKTEKTEKVETPVEKPLEIKENQPEPPKSVATKNAHVDEEPETSAPAAKIPKTEYEVICDGDVCVRRPKDQALPSQSPAENNEPVPVIESDISIEEKMERAKELIEIRRREKEAKLKEEEKQKEKERRSQGQGVAELKKWQADQELKQIQEERKREKMENNLARQRILEQIAQDRAERKAREQPPAPPAAPIAPPTPPAVGDVGGRARVQFKLPDGAAHTAHFAADAPLADVQRYVADNLHLPMGSFSLWTAFPRRELDSPSESLLALRLAPSAALLVLPRRVSLPPARPSPLAALTAFITQLFTTFVLDPSYQIYSWLRNRIFPTPTIPPGPTTPPNPQDPQNPQHPPGQGLRRRGNIHRLTGDRSGDDENNTWNGNSTQQM
ncbi:unnamed protein product, partial [Brenthis ino]